VIAVEFKEITKEYRGQPVLKGIDFSVKSGTFTVIFGGPGCGKSVVLRLMTGLEKPSVGRVFMREKDVTDIAPGERNIGYVPQMFALYPHYKVYDNIVYPLRLTGLQRKEADPLVYQTAEMLHIIPLLDKFPDQLSGGEKQRVALARGIVKQTDIYVLDDPLSGLDFKLREKLFDELLETQKSLNSTFIYTTSDPLETLILAEDIIVLDSGRVVETGSLDQVYTEPQHVRTMELLDFPNTNVLKGSLYTRGGQVWCDTGLVEFPVEITRSTDVFTEGQRVSVAVRSQNLKLNPEQTEDMFTFLAEVVLREDLGGELLVHLDSNGSKLLSVIRHDEAHLLSNGQVTVAVSAPAFLLYSLESGKRIGKGAK